MFDLPYLTLGMRYLKHEDPVNEMRWSNIND